METADWIVKTASVSKAGGLHITGENLSARDEIDRSFSWTIEHYSINSDRYDWSGCEWAPGARSEFARLMRRWCSHA